jgi:hypothetical protein
MDEAKARSQIQDHADAVVRGDMDHVVGDFCEEMRPQVPGIAKELPMPVKSAEVLSVDVGDEESVAQIKYTGDSGELTIQSHWREIDGRPQIVAGKPLG